MSIAAKIRREYEPSNESKIGSALDKAKAAVFGSAHLSYYDWLTETYKCKDRNRRLAEELNPDLPHIRLFIQRVQNMGDRTVQLLINLSAPRHGKTEFTGKYAALWLCDRYPGCNIAFISANTIRAGAVSEETRSIADQIGVLGDSTAIISWRTTNGSNIRCFGAGQSLKGFNFDFIIVDDPIANTDDFFSEIDRESKWRWWNMDLMERQQDHTCISLTYTTSHYDDLGQRIMKRSSLPWDVMKLPVKAGQDDMLGRKPGEWLSPKPNSEKRKRGVMPTGIFSVAWYEAKEREMKKNDPAGWNSTWLCSPGAAEGDVIHADRITILAEPPSTLSKRTRVYDIAHSTKSSADETVGIYMASFIDAQGIECLWIEDMWHQRMNPGDRDLEIQQTAIDDGTAVKILLPRDASTGIYLTTALDPMLQGYSVQWKRQMESKANRAGNLASVVNRYRCFMRQADWNDYLKEQFRQFPNAPHDDVPDCAAFGCNDVLFSTDSRFNFDPVTNVYDSQFFEDSFGGSANEIDLLSDERAFRRWAGYMFSTDSTTPSAFMYLFARDMAGTVYVYDEIAFQGTMLQGQVDAIKERCKEWRWFEKGKVKPAFCPNEFYDAVEPGGNSRWRDMSVAGVPLYGQKTDEVEGLANVEMMLTSQLKGDPALMIHERCRFLKAYLASTPRDTRNPELIDKQWIGYPSITALRVGLTAKLSKPTAVAA